MAQFMLLLYDDQKLFTRMSPEEMQQAMGKYMAWRKEPFTVDGKRLTDDYGKVLRPNSGAVDGPFSATKEILGGYYTIEAPDYDAAVKLTETHPHLAYGGSIELRKVY
jgi:hypothetical protein